MQYPQTRYSDTLATGISDSALSLTAGTTPPTRTQGILTIGRQQSNTEDVFYTGVAGNVVTISLRGLSQTALTPTTVLANKKVHNANESLEMTTHHNYDTNLLRKDEDDTVSGIISFTSAGNSFTNAPKVPGLKDVSGNETIDTPATGAAVNQLKVQNAAAGTNVIVTTAGDDADINLELQAKGAGKVIVEDAAEMKTNAAPVAAAGIANKKYVDDTFTGTVDTKVKVTGADTTPDVLNNKLVVSTHLAKATLNPGANEQMSLSTDAVQAYSGIANQLVATNADFEVDGGLRTGLYDRVTYGDTNAAKDLLYQDPADMKWKRVTSTASTWYHRLGIAVDAGINGDTNKRVLLKGRVGGLTFSNINPTFSSALVGTAYAVGNAAGNRIQAIRIDNSSGAEAIITGGTISAREQGGPTADFKIALVLQQTDNGDQINSPAVYWDETNDVPRGAIVATATISELLFSGTFAALAFSFGGNVKVPAGASVYLVCYTSANVDGVNYYEIQSDATAPKRLDSGTQTWAGSNTAGNTTLTVTSTSPVGYAVKAYTGVSGTYGLTPTNPWSRVIGHVLSATEMMFDPEWKRSKVDYSAYSLHPTASNGIATLTTNFCPSELNINVTCSNDGTADISYLHFGSIRGDYTGAPAAGQSFFQVSSLSKGSGFNSSNYLGLVTGAGAEPIGRFANLTGPFPLALQATSQNFLHAVRLENGYHIFNGYPTGANFISTGNAGFVEVFVDYEVKSQV